MSRYGVFVLSLLIASFAPASAQSIPIKTIPLATGNQYLLFPSSNISMGGVSLSLDDPWGDPYANPAAGMDGEGIRLLASPAAYGILMTTGSSGESSGKTLPVGILFRSAGYFGGLTWARQSIAPEERRGTAPMPFPLLHSQFPTVKPSRANTYVFGTFGAAIPGSSWSVGASVLWADLAMIEGLQHLYAGAVEIDPAGVVSEYRLGLKGELEGGRSLQLVASHQKTDMEHTITRLTWVRPTDDLWFVVPEYRQSVERDRTLGYGLRASYHQPLKDEWRIGGTVVGNWKSHPKIPNYELMNIPRDPGHSFASQIGIGVSHHGTNRLAGMDVVYEPIVSTTWADTDVPVTTAGGRVISIGDRTVENEFRFYNYHLRFGVRTSRQANQVGAGIHLYHIKYYLKQIDRVNEVVRRQKEEWTELTFSLGFGFRIFGARLHYLGLVTTGTGQSGVGGGFRTMASPIVSPMDSFGSDFVVAPSGPLTLRDALVLSHQLSVFVDLP